MLTDDFQELPDHGRRDPGGNLPWRALRAEPAARDADLVHVEDQARYLARRQLYIQQTGSPPPDGPRG